MSNSAKKHTVDRTRLTYVLAALAGSMAVGSVVLGMLEPRSANAADPRKQIVAATLTATVAGTPSRQVAQTKAPIKSESWNGVVIHRVGSDMKVRCLGTDHASAVAHFVVNPKGEVLVTSQWENQRFITGYEGKVQVGIQLASGQQVASYDQAAAVVYLVRYLQACSNIPSSKVFLHSQLSDHACGADPLAAYNWQKSLMN